MNIFNLIRIKKYYKQNKLIELPKSDIHSHAGRSGNIEFIEKKLNCHIDRPPEKFTSLQEMQKWFDENIKKVCVGYEGMLLRWEAGFYEAKRNNIKRLTLSFSTFEVEICGGIEKFISVINGFYKEYIPDSLFEPELTFDSRCNVELEVKKMDVILPYNFFKSIDICGEENVRDIEDYLPLYKKAEEYNLIKKMHIGECGTAEDIEKAVLILDLDEIHHGIAAANSPRVMKLLQKRKIQLNICPSSNVMLGIVSDYSHHPIKTLVKNKVLITINTDDLLIFNQPIDQEYYNLYEAKTLKIKDLERIRLNGLNK